MAKIGFIGLGNMGLPMAKNLVMAGHEVIGFDLIEECISSLVEVGGRGGERMEDCVLGVNAIITMLPEGKHVDSVYGSGILGSAAKDTLLIDCSTIDVDTARSVGEKAKNLGYSMVDAPVSGGTGGAEAGTLTFMVGGEENIFNLAKP